MSHNHSLGGIGYKIAGDEGILHSDVPHSDAVTNGDGGEDYRGASGHGDAELYRLGDLIKLHVTGDYFVI